MSNRLTDEARDTIRRVLEPTDALERAMDDVTGPTMAIVYGLAQTAERAQYAATLAATRARTAAYRVAHALKVAT